MVRSVVGSLESLCIQKISSDFYHFKNQLKHLPHNLKNELSIIAGRRDGLLEDLELLEGLLNVETELLYFEHCNVTNTILQHITMCKNLKVLNIGSHALVTSDVLCLLFSCLTELEQFTAKKCPAVNDEVISCLSRYCPHLAVIDVADCTEIGDKSLISLTNNPLLAINMSGCQITDRGVSHMVFGQAKTELREINLDNCFITSKSVELLIRLCPRLSIFSFKNNKFYSDFDIPELRKFKQLSWTIP